MKTIDQNVQQKEYLCQKEQRIIIKFIIFIYYVLKLITFSHCVCRSLPEHEKNAGSEKDKILQEKEAELKRMQDVIAKMQAQIQQQTP